MWENIRTERIVGHVTFLKNYKDVPELRGALFSVVQAIPGRALSDINFRKLSAEFRRKLIVRFGDWFARFHTSGKIYVHPHFGNFLLEEHPLRNKTVSDPIIIDTKYIEEAVSPITEQRNLELRIFLEEAHSTGLVQKKDDAELMVRYYASKLGIKNIATFSREIIQGLFE